MPKSCQSCGDTATTWDHKHNKWDWDSDSGSSDDCHRKCDGWKAKKCGTSKCCPEKKRSCCVKAWDFNHCENRCNPCWRSAVQCGGCLGCASNVWRCLDPKYNWWNEWYPKNKCGCGCKCHHNKW